MGKNRDMPTAAVQFCRDFAPLLISLTLVVARILLIPGYDFRATVGTDVAYSILTFDVWAGLTRVRGGYLVGPNDRIPGETLIVVALVHVALLFGVARMLATWPSAWGAGIGVALLGYFVSFTLILYAHYNNLGSGAEEV